MKRKLEPPEQQMESSSPRLSSATQDADTDARVNESPTSGTLTNEPLGHPSDGLHDGSAENPESGRISHMTAFTATPPGRTLRRVPSACAQTPQRRLPHARTALSTAPPGREDEFSSPNGEQLGKVSTLSPERSFDTVLQELTAIQQDGPRNVAILGAGGTNAAVIRGALRAEKPDLLTVVLPQSLGKQPKETQEQLLKVQNLIEMKKNDPLPLDVASQLCNSDILSRCTHFIAFAFHDSDVILESVRQAKELRIVVTVLYLD